MPDTIEFIKFMALNKARIDKAADDEANEVLKRIAEAQGFPMVHNVTLTAAHIRTLVRSCFFAGANYQAQWEDEQRARTELGQ